MRFAFAGQRGPRVLVSDGLLYSSSRLQSDALHFQFKGLDWPRQMVHGKSFLDQQFWSSSELLFRMRCFEMAFFF